MALKDPIKETQIEDNANDSYIEGRNQTVFAYLLPLVDHENKMLGNARVEQLPQLLIASSKFTYLITPIPGLPIPFSGLNRGLLKKYKS